MFAHVCMCVYMYVYVCVCGNVYDKSTSLSSFECGVCLCVCGMLYVHVCAHECVCGVYVHVCVRAYAEVRGGHQMSSKITQVCSNRGRVYW